MTQLGLGLDGVLIVETDGAPRAGARRPRASAAGQLSLLELVGRAQAEAMERGGLGARTVRGEGPGPRSAGGPVGLALAADGPGSLAPPAARELGRTSSAVMGAADGAPVGDRGKAAESAASTVALGGPPTRGAPHALGPAPTRGAPHALGPAGRAAPAVRAAPSPATPAARAKAAEAAPVDPPRRRRPAVREEALLEAELGRRIGGPVLVRVTDNTSTMISFKRRGRALYVRAHRMFATAPAPVLDALALFVSRDEIARKDARLLDEWIERHRHVLTEARSDALKVTPLGEVHDLAAMFDRLNRAHFGGRITATITWTRAAKGQRRTSIHMGTYEAELGLIRIHPALDQAWVPEYFVEFVVFHEMLHQVHGVAGHGEGRRAVHPPAFRADEKRFPRYAEARRWEKDNLRRLLRY